MLVCNCRRSSSPSAFSYCSEVTRRWRVSVAVYVSNRSCSVARPFALLDRKRCNTTRTSSGNVDPTRQATREKLSQGKEIRKMCYLCRPLEVWRASPQAELAPRSLAIVLYGV
jgi:hypothetical protein